MRHFRPFPPALWLAARLLLVMLPACGDPSLSGNAAGTTGLADDGAGALADVADGEVVQAPVDATATALEDAELTDATPTSLADATPTGLADTHVPDAGAEVVGSGPPYPIVLCHGFFGFNDFAGAGFLT